MLTRFYVDNFICLENFEITLEDINILVGPNGVGKSSMFQALRRIQKLVIERDSIEDLFPAGDLCNSLNRSDQKFELEIQIDFDIYGYTLVIEHDRVRKVMRISEETLTFNNKTLFNSALGNAQLFRDDFTEGPNVILDWRRSGIGAIIESADNLKLTRFKKQLGNFIIASPCPPIFEPESRTEDVFLDPLMRNFVGWYRHAAQENMGGVVELITELRKSLPGFESINLEETGGSSRALRLDFFVPEIPLRFHVDFDKLSDGQKTIVALYSLLFIASKEKIFLFLDEPDNYLSPREIQPFLTMVEDRCDSTVGQAVIISHHPHTVDYLAGGACSRFFYRETNGPVRVTDALGAMDGLSLSETIARGWER